MSSQIALRCDAVVNGESCPNSIGGLLVGMEAHAVRLTAQPMGWTYRLDTTPWGELRIHDYCPDHPRGT